MKASEEIGDEASSQAWAFCSLSPAQREARREMVRAEVLPHVRRRQVSADGFTWECADSPAARASLEELVALEKSCCGDLDFALRRDPETNTLRLEVGAAGLDVAQLEALRGLANLDVEGGRGPLAAVGRAALLGAGGALLLCCVLPAALAGVAGAAVMGSLAQLDRPLPLLGTALIIAAISLVVARRRRAPRLPETEAPATTDESPGACGC